MAARYKATGDLGDAAHKGSYIEHQIHQGADLTADEVEFGAAMEAYKRRWGRPFPSWSEVLAVVKSLGYRKVS
jgi:hypothetical protein